MIQISDNDLRQLLLFVKATDGRVQGEQSDLRLNNRVRLAKTTLRKLMRRADVQRVMGGVPGTLPQTCVTPANKQAKGEQ